MPCLVMILALFWDYEFGEQTIPHWKDWIWSSLGEKKIFYKSAEKKIKGEWKILLEMILRAWRTAGAIVQNTPLDMQRMRMHRKVEGK